MTGEIQSHGVRLVLLGNTAVGKSTLMRSIAADLVEEVPRGRLGKLATVNEEGKPSIVPSTPRRDGAGVNGDGAPLPPIPATPCVLRRPFIHVTTRLTTKKFKAY